MIQLKPFQLEGARAIYRFGGRALLADEMGLGKTIQALYWIHKIQRRPVVIVAPPGLCYTWQSEAALHFEMRVEVLEGERPKRARRLPGPVVVVGYSTLESWLPLLLDARPECVIFDEIQYCKELGSQRAQAAIKLSQGPASVVGLSGTPLVNRPIELWLPLQLIRPDLFPSRYEYAWRYCKPHKTRWGWKFDGSNHEAELHRILTEQCMVRRKKAVVERDLPAKQTCTVPFRLASWKMRQYDYALLNFRSWLRGLGKGRAHRARKSLALVKVGYLVRLAVQLKFNMTADWIARFHEQHPKEKLVCFTMHTDVINRLRERFPDALVINGKVRGRKRQETVRLFQNNRSRWLMLGNWKAAGVGITLTAAAHAAGLDFPWTPGDLLQGGDRIHRIGQKRAVTLHYLVALGTVEEKQVALLLRKFKILSNVLDGEQAGQDFDVFEELLRTL